VGAQKGGVVALNCGNKKIFLLTFQPEKAIIKKGEEKGLEYAQTPKIVWAVKNCQ